MRIDSFPGNDVILFHRENCYGIRIDASGQISFQWYDLQGVLSTEVSAQTLTLNSNVYVSLIRDEVTQCFTLALNGLVVYTSTASTLNVF
jgi:hypothetical protein